MKKGILLFYLVLLGFIAISQDINKNEVEKVAINLFNKISKSPTQAIEIINVIKNDTVLLYIAHNNKDFIIVANELRVNPILGYSDEGSYDANNMPPQLLYLLESYKEEIIAVKRGKFEKLKSYNDDWQNYLKADFTQTKASVAPIIQVKWNQGSGWNRFCPEDADGPGGHVYAGCVAVSMAQSMSVYEHPTQGVGESSYYPPNGYPLQEANYGETQYQWDLMSSTSSNDYNALLLYHCAVSLRMGFSPDGSGAYTKDIATALKNHFDYSSSVYAKSSTEDQAWIDLLKSELDAGRPISYGGNNGVDVGHAFNLDGYNSSDAFHVNWGWSGSYNGYYQISALTPNGSDFSKGAKAVLNIMPKDHSSTDIIISSESFIDTLAADSLICVISTVDPDNDDVFEYRVKGSEGIFGENYCPFYINNDSLKLKEKVNYEDHKKLIIEITSEDSQGNIFKKEFTIKVIKPNYIPTDINITNIIFNDTISDGDLIGIFNTIDEDEVDTFTYKFEVNENPDIGKDNSKFIISNDSLISNYDFNNYDGTQCSIFVESSDKRNETVTKEIVLEISHIETSTYTDLELKSHFEVFPNPSNFGLFYINLSNTKTNYIGKNYSLSVYNLQGVREKTIEGVFLGNDISFKLNKRGYYIVRLIIDNKLAAKKILYE